MLQAIINEQIEFVLTVTLYIYISIYSSICKMNVFCFFMYLRIIKTILRIECVQGGTTILFASISMSIRMQYKYYCAGLDEKFRPTTRLRPDSNGKIKIRGNYMYLNPTAVNSCRPALEHL